MAYFNNAFNKAAVIAATEASAAQTTQSLTAGQLGIVDANTYLTTAFPLNATTNIPDKFLLVYGNYNTVDTLDGNDPSMHGGYAESIKSKVINKKYVRAVWEQDVVTASTQVVTITIPDTCFKCDGSTAEGNQLRLDIKGAETLRFLNRFSYATFMYNECCASGVSTVGGDLVAAAWKDQINADPLLKNFVTATNGAGAADNTLILTLAYTPTFFADCSFDTRDYVGTAPLELIVSAVDDDGLHCVNTCMTAAVAGVAVTDFGTNTATGVSVKAETTGETVLRQVIMDGRYRQDGGWNQGNKDSARFRDIQKADALTAAVDRTAFYSCFYLLHSVPRFNNPTGVFDNDQYLLKYYVLSGSAEHAKMEFLMKSIAAEAGVTYGDY